MLSWMYGWWSIYKPIAHATLQAMDFSQRGQGILTKVKPISKIVELTKHNFRYTSYGLGTYLFK